jgi:hypothetical protein
MAAQDARLAMAREPEAVKRARHTGLPGQRTGFFCIKALDAAALQGDTSRACSRSRVQGGPATMRWLRLPANLLRSVSGEYILFPRAACGGTRQLWMTTLSPGLTVAKVGGLPPLRSSVKP